MANSLAKELDKKLDDNIVQRKILISRDFLMLDIIDKFFDNRELVDYLNKEIKANQAKVEELSWEYETLFMKWKKALNND